MGADPRRPFILARLEAAGLRPAPPADRRSLLRRIHFALLGLPPTPEEVEDFVEDQAPDALERVVNRLLASPHFGERWARHWMDLVRYSDTLGNEADMPIPNAWRYRDYLVRAFNADLPYDRLILEHLGGDLLDDPRHLRDGSDNESILGTAFFWMSEGKRSPVNLRQAQAESFDNRLDVIGKTFLGLTVACARCHDHKFDPVTQEDYYGLYGYLKSSRYTQTLLNRVEIDDAAARMAALRVEIGRAAGAAWATHAAMIPRYLMAALRVRSDEDVPRVSRSEGLRPDRLRLWAKATKESALDPGHPMFAWRRIADLGSEPTAEAVAARWREIQAETRAARHIATRREGRHRPGRLRPIGLPGLVRRGPGVRPGAVAAGRGPARGRNPPGRSPPSREAGRGRTAGIFRDGCKGRSARRRSPSTGDSSTSWRRGGRRG